MSNNDTYNTPIGEVPRVTKILGLLDKPALRSWCSRTTADYIKQEIEEACRKNMNINDILDDIIINGVKAPNMKRDSAAGKGSDVHNLIELDLRGQKVHVKDNPFYNAYLDFKEDHKIECLMPEHTVWHTRLFGGTLDFYGKIDGKLSICDWKTGSYASPTHLMQVAAYMKALEQMEGIEGKIEQVCVLYLSTYGETKKAYKFKVYERDKADWAWNRFKHLLGYWHLTKGEKEVV